MTKRLLVLKTMGLVEHAGANIQGCQRLLTVTAGLHDLEDIFHRALMSDDPLPLVMLDIRNLTTLEGTEQIS